MADLIDLSIFDVTPQQGIDVQNRMRQQMSLIDDLGDIKTVGGVDASVSRFIKQGKCAVVVLSFPELELIETKIHHAPITFPDRVEVGVRVAKLGNSSVRYEIGIFREGDAAPAATGHFVHVYVDRETRRPVTIPDPVREVLSGLVLDADRP